ncbi:hypothetical protein G7B40_013355 [Aetokthonos hydrillicola Thurmond2011]|jgi:hypothetical protein|uniref:Uncharacterized protein n=1 Tax=Aetokthonos hydrillicola Thurmond2011 TaxID=2712845 RepID=A0AAP5I670_9CYAN|nr:hypothetical protein [Aetokthonos hydrillicola]MBO3463362.1 hypothetical protein [Aetokthonos hydrillicola CCALA 1050]MBW4583760.1 hypothetical protein [Aetokthonos hydrillicola CCALA 1050]MDR9895546.1 hypothetical protein [Aetokthonos hydrillicola Thurmond2011]
MVKFYVRTRGLRTDYSFLPEQPTIRDLKDYRNGSDFEKPTCILERTEEKGVYLFLTGIPSRRKDHQGTRIRYDLVATVDSEVWEDDDDNEKKALTGLIWLWLNDVKSALWATQEDGKQIDSVRLPLVEKSKLGKLFDESLPEDYLEKLLQRINNGECGEDDKSLLDKNLKNLLLKIPKQTICEPESDCKAWWGGINNDASCNKWIKLVEKLLTSETSGKALLPNIANPQSLGRLFRNSGELGVLLAKEWSQENPNLIETQISLKSDLNLFEKIAIKGQKDVEMAKKNLQKLLLFGDQ